MRACLRPGAWRLALVAAATLPLALAAAACQTPTVTGDPRDGAPVAPPSPSPTTPDAGAAPDPQRPDAMPPAPLPPANPNPPPAPSACPGGTGTATPRPCADFGVIVVPQFAPRYSCFDLGPVPGVPAQKYGGLTLTSERCSTRLLIGGAANLPDGKLYAVNVTRDGAGHINGFQGTATVQAEAPYNDGGISFGPMGVLFITRYPNNELQQTLPNSRAADKVIPLTPLMIQFSTGALNFVPAALGGGPTALRMVSWSGGQWYNVRLAPDGRGTYDIMGVTHVLTLPGGPEGFVYVAAGSPLLPANSLLVSEWSANKIAVYDVDGSGDPVIASRRDFITGLQGAEGAYRDPVTGDFFFSTWGQAADRVIVVRGFSPIIE